MEGVYGGDRVSGKRFDTIISGEDSFEKADLLNRKELADSLLSLFKVSSEPIVVALDDDWGTGKTYFLKLWEKMLTEEGIPVVYYNAFESDFSGDAFVTLAATLIDASKQHTNSAKGVEKFLKRAARFGKIVSKSAVNVALKAGTAGVVDAADAGEAMSAAIAQAGEETNKQFERLISERSKYRAEKETFSESLQMLRALMQDQDAGKDYPLIVIVDELDRCRPNFALDVLECLKHFFETEKTHFLLGVSIDSLAHSVSAIYGSGINGERYLSRFIDYRISFYPSRYSSSEKELEEYAESLWERSDALKIHQEEKSEFAGIIAKVAARNNGSLRDINRIFSVLHLCLASISESTFKAPPIIAGLVLMKYYEPKLFKKAIEKKLTFQEVSGFFDFLPEAGKYSPEERSIEWIHEWWATFLGGKVSEEIASSIKSSLFRYNFHRADDVISICARNIVDRYWQGGG